jgi:hypothetical protein
MIPAPSSPVPIRSVVQGRPSTREARLRPDAAHQYRWIETGRWQPAALLADQVLAGHLLRGTHNLTWRRALPEAHFEFRGGAARGESRDAGRPRREDR